MSKQPSTPWCLAALLCLLLSGCENAPADTNSKVLSSRGMGIDRYYDEEYGVACYRYWTHGISCVKVTTP